MLATLCAIIIFRQQTMQRIQSIPVHPQPYQTQHFAGWAVCRLQQLEFERLLDMLRPQLRHLELLLSVGHRRYEECCSHHSGQHSYIALYHLPDL